MARVRFYTEGGEQYVTLRVEDDGLYLLDNPIKLHRKRVKMPPKKPKQQVSEENSAQLYARLKDPTLVEKVIAVLCDIEETIGLDSEAMASVKSAYKAAGVQFGVKYRSAWTNYAGPNLLAALLQYHDEVLAEE